MTKQLKYKTPKGYTDEDVVQAIETATTFITRVFQGFGFYDKDDLKQFGAYEAIKVLAQDKYDEKRPLVNFLYRHIRNRMINLRRDKLRRNDPPCKQCHEELPGNTSHSDRQYCKSYTEWLHRNVTKQNLLCPKTFDGVSDEENDALSREYPVEDSEMLNEIDQKLPVELRADYLRMREGIPISKSAKAAVVHAVSGIIWEKYGL